MKFQRKSSGRNAVSRPKPEITIVLIDSLIIQSLLANRPKDHSKIQASSKLYELNLFAKLISWPHAFFDTNSHRIQHGILK